MSSSIASCNVYSSTDQSPYDSDDCRRDKLLNTRATRGERRLGDVRVPQLFCEPMDQRILLVTSARQ